jgi:hypothetical protein
MTDLKECKIIQKPKTTIQTPCGKFLIETENHCIYR